MNRRHLLATTCAAVAFAGLPLASFAQEAAPEIPEMMIGDPDAPIEMIEYASFTCPHCARFHTDVYPELKADYIDTGKVRFIYREVYFDRPGLWASMTARCGGEDKFFGITDLVYATQAEWSASRDPATIAAELRKIGLTAGITPEDYDACLKDGQMAQGLFDWYKANAERDEITGTPSFMINDVRYSNMNYNDLKIALDDFLN